MNRFYEFLFRREEFVFLFENKKFEVVYDKNLQLYENRGNQSILIQEFKNCEDFFNNGKINGQFIKDVYLLIETEF